MKLLSQLFLYFVSCIVYLYVLIMDVSQSVYETILKDAIVSIIDMFQCIENLDHLIRLI